MGYRYCPECDEWLPSHEYEIADDGERVCPDHKAVHGYITDPPWTPQKFLHEHPDWYDDRYKMLKAARRQGLIDE